MQEMPDAGEYHGDAVIVNGLDDFLIFYRTARLDGGVAPASVAPIMPSANGKKASAATTTLGQGSASFNLGRRLRALHHGQARRIDAAHLPSADADHRVFPRQTMVFDFTCLKTFHAKSRARSSASLGARFDNDLADAHVERGEVAVLHEHAADDLLHVEPARSIAANGTSSSRTFFFADEDPPGFGAERRSDDDLEKDVLDLLGGLAVDLAVGADDAAEDRHGIAGAALAKGVRQRDCGDRHAARIGVLEWQAAAVSRNSFDQLERRIGVDDVVVRELLALELRRLGARLRAEVAGLA